MKLFYILCIKCLITQLHVNYKVCGGVHVHVLVFPLLNPRYQGLLAFVDENLRFFAAISTCAHYCYIELIINYGWNMFFVPIQLMVN
jgi:hypothetical protein